ncbi:M20 family metallopeptidase [Halomonas maura]|uniref:M20 family metallopeptidase n=1 Tax=Halomonas maura TaxID=117606 RepID=UPI0025B28426|nr:M20 family metallopeptidase [Halomonas maura]MDN3556522.1 M20 family metallopeptidase [Halomonas maura]
MDMTIDRFDYSELKSLIAINSYTKNKAGVDQAGRLVRSWMEPLGFQTQVYPRSDIGDHLHFTSAKCKGTRILLLGHLDTVFPPGTFEGFFEDDHWIYGPGVCDMKGGFYIAISALRAVQKKFGAIANIDLLLVSDEESGSDDSKRLTRQLAEDYDACLVFEAAGKNGDVVIGRKGIATYEVTIVGKAAHAGNHYQSGIDANLAAAHMIIELSKLTCLAEGTTVNAGKMQGGIGANTISPKAQLKVEARFCSGSEKARVTSAIKGLVTHNPVAGVHITIEGGVQRDVMEPNPAQMDFLAQLESIIDAPIPTERRGGVSDANVVAEMHIPTLDGLGPFGEYDHTVDERACKSSFLRRLDQVTRILSFYNQCALANRVA